MRKPIPFFASLAGIGLLAASLLSTAPPAAATGTNAEKVGVNSPRCTVRYALAPGERSVRLCQHRPPTHSGIVIVESGSEFVDASLIQRLGQGSHVISITNRSAEVVRGTATISTY